MKKISVFFSILSCAFVFAQTSELNINNYSSLDYKGVVIAKPNGGCYPVVSNTYTPNPPYSMITVPANTNLNVGFFRSGLVVKYWDVQTSATNPVIVRTYNHQSLNSTSVISTSTDWQHSKFEMFDPNTGLPASPGINISSGTSTCALSPSYYSDPNSTLEAEWFTITSGGKKYTFLQIYN